MGVVDHGVDSRTRADDVRVARPGDRDAPGRVEGRVLLVASVLDAPRVDDRERYTSK
ncbi:hypothetical protein [Halorubellus sp. PRR65]|uniref:hypothetical protein n=1 Tax=Halorubellus sp. PRR65 TaxID=3098148 RepID=UPI002B2566C8|nr:hypothetical protein [Halorubellus sp. PRR65]